MPSLRIASVLAFLLLGACRSGAPAARTAAAPVELPARYDEGRWYVAPVTAKGETLLFFTDSGGGADMLFAPVAEHLGLPRETVEMDGQKVEVVAFPALAPGASIPLPTS
ncbi:MAG TPA: hypothetical protein VGR07_12070, partial [Thermoanaerobaculia bacterium]|nr:hypothetical protein [Thermoanaerobaculia bacterium]